MAASTMRHFVLYAPFGPKDVSIYPDHQERMALADWQRRKDAGEAVSFQTGSGTITDVRVTLRRLRAEHLAKLAKQVRA